MVGFNSKDDRKSRELITSTNISVIQRVDLAIPICLQQFAPRKFAFKGLKELALSTPNAKCVTGLLITASSRQSSFEVLLPEYGYQSCSIQKIIYANAADLRKLIDTMNNHLIGLKNINRPVESWDDLMVYIITSKLDPDTLNKWNEEAPIDRLPALSELLNFLKRRCQILESNLNSVSLPGGAPTSRAIEPKRVQRTAKSFVTIKNFCSFCQKPENANHNMGDQAQPKNFAALKTQHTERNILAIAIVYIISKYKQRFPCRVLVDGGSQINMISERMVHMTGLKRQYAPIQFQCANKTITK
ncbi:hypothetical protein GQX74_004900 [Glossina fuscipes]|nr:hypothetical protein GQX74_004900 [Glossina fuscipes]